jgi:hypothetical protein
MATKPTVIPSWATSGTIVDPGSSKKALGWIVEDPPYEYFNYLHNAAGQWIEYLNIILTGTSDNLTIRAEEGTAGITTVRGGSSPAGTNQTGGPLWLQAGTSTGSAGSSVVIYASTAGSSGSGVNTNEIYARANGSTGTFQILKDTHISGVTVVGTSGTPVSGSTFSVNTTGVANSLVVRTADGNIGINSNGNAAAKLFVAGALNSSTSASVDVRPSFGSSVSAGIGIRSRIDRDAGGTFTEALHFIASGGTLTTTPTSQVGFRVDSNLTGGTNNYAFRSLLNASGTANWNVYMSGTAPNWMSGTTVIGPSNSIPTGSTFSVNTTGVANSLVVRTADGNVGINNNGATTAKMVLSGTVPGGTSSLGLLNSTVHTENTTGNLTGFSSNISRTGAGTLSNVFHFLSNPGSFSVTPTNHHGFHAAAATGGVGTNNYGFFGALASGSGNWNFFGAGSAPNHFNGATVIGASSTIPSGSAFSVNSTGVSNSLVVRSAEGNIGINSNGNTDNKVLVAGSLNTGSTSTSVRSDVSFGSSVTASAVGFRSQIARSSGGTLTNLVGFQAFNGTLDITPTNNIGFQVGALSTGTNVYGFHGQIAAATGRYNLYMSGTAQNFLAGATTIGSTLTVTGTSTLAAVNATNGTFSGTLGVTGTSTLGTTNTGALSASTVTATGLVTAPVGINLAASSDPSLVNGKVWARSGFLVSTNGTSVYSACHKTFQSGVRTSTSNSIIPMGTAIPTRDGTVIRSKFFLSITAISGLTGNLLVASFFNLAAKAGEATVEVSSPAVGHKFLVESETIITSSHATTGTCRTQLKFYNHQTGQIILHTAAHSGINTATVTAQRYAEIDASSFTVEVIGEFVEVMF